MRICFVTEYFNPDSSGGTPSVLPNLLRYLTDNYSDLEINVITSNNSYRDPHLKYSSFEDWYGVLIYRINCPRSNQSSALIRLIMGLWFSVIAGFKLVWRGRCDVILVGTNPPSAPLFTKLSLRVRKIPYVYLIHDLYPDIIIKLGLLSKEHIVSRFAKYFQKKWFRSAEKVIVIGRCMREHIIDAYGVPLDKVQVITSWADPKAITLLPKNTQFKKKHNLSGFIVLWAGNFGRYQNFDDILEAARLLQESGQNMTFVFVGEGAKKKYVVHRAAEKKLNNIRFITFVPVDDFADLLASADVSLVTLESNMEGVGVPSKFYNILASGRPALAILDPFSEIARVLDEYKCGIRVDRGKPHELAEEFLKLFHSPEVLRKMGQNARKAFFDKYTISKIADQYYKVFREAVPSR